MKVSFDGWTTENVIDWEEKFEEEYNDDGELILVSKETFTNEEDEDLPAFEYKYVIRCWDLPRYGSDDNSISVELFMAPLPKYYNKETLNKLIKYFGYESAEDIWFGECIDECSVKIADEYISYDENDKEGFYDVLDNNEVVNTLNAIASVLNEIDTFKAFKLDAAWNFIGTTGWDTLRETLLGEDRIMASINRYKKGDKNESNL